MHAWNECTKLWAFAWNFDFSECWMKLQVSELWVFDYCMKLLIFDDEMHVWMYENVEKSRLWMREIFGKHIHGCIMIDLVLPYWESMWLWECKETWVKLFLFSVFVFSSKREYKQNSSYVRHMYKWFSKVCSNEFSNKYVQMIFSWLFSKICTKWFFLMPQKKIFFFNVFFSKSMYKGFSSMIFLTSQRNEYKEFFNDFFLCFKKYVQ